MPNFDTQDWDTLGWAAYGGSDAAHIVPFSYHGVGFPSGMADILVPQTNYLLDRIVPLIQGGVCTHDYGNGLTGNYGYQSRDKVGGGSGRSAHSWGNAFDLNAVQNAQGTNYGRGQFQVPPEAAGICQSLGWLCGGSFNGLTDPMHFENHNSVSEILAWNAAHAGSHPLPVASHPVPVAAGATPFPLPGNCYYGPFSGPAQSISGQGRNDAQYQPGLKRAQAKLHIGADGIYGPITALAIRNFQAAHHLAVDGLLGPNTWKALGA